VALINSGYRLVAGQILAQSVTSCQQSVFYLWVTKWKIKSINCYYF